MNQPDSPAPKFSWMKIGLIVVVLILVAFFSGRSGLEDILGLQPGTLGGKVAQEQPDDSARDLDSDRSDSSASHSDKSSTAGAGESGRGQANATAKDFELKRNGFVYESPQGLTYYVGDRGENRIDHVMRHAKDQPDRRGSHGVFVGGKNEIFATIDEAYSLIKSNSRYVLKKERDKRINTRVAYEIDLRRKIGYKGGKTGKSKGYPDLRIMKLILDKGNRVITAYPYR